MPLPSQRFGEPVNAQRTWHSVCPSLWSRIHCQLWLLVEETGSQSTGSRALSFSGSAWLSDRVENDPSPVCAVPLCVPELRSTLCHGFSWNDRSIFYRSFLHRQIGHTQRSQEGTPHMYVQMHGFQQEPMVCLLQGSQTRRPQRVVERARFL